MRLKILKYVYHHFMEYGTQICRIPFNQIGTNLSEINNAFHNLESDGYIEMRSTAIGEAYVYLTDYCLSFCEQNFRL